MPTTAEALAEKVRSLPSEQLGEVERFVDYLVHREARQAALRRLTLIAPALAEAGVEPATEDDVQREIDAARAERRGRRAVGA
mgnify:CR=1 FL=1